MSALVEYAALTAGLLVGVGLLIATSLRIND
jgi:hypothetical protein